MPVRPNALLDAPQTLAQNMGTTLLRRIASSRFDELLSPVFIK